MKPAYLLPLLIVVAGCTDRGASYQPVLDGRPNAAYPSDLAECQTLARDQQHLNRSTKQAVLIGAGIGAVLGEVDNDSDPLGGAIVGAISGGAAGTSDAADKRETIVIECLRHRGHPVVG